MESDKVSKEDKKFIRDVIYRQELLNIFYLEEYDEIEINKSIHNLYDKIKECIELKECMLQLSNNFMSVDETIGLIVMFSYDYLYLTHNCICELFVTGKITHDSMCKLKHAILYF